MPAAYLALADSGELARRAERALDRLIRCDLCPRNCGVDRTMGQLGWCRTGRHAQVASYDLHFGEEEVLVGECGSGTIFFAQCNLACAFCQNSEISKPGRALPEDTPQVLAHRMLILQEKGAANINLVTPSHVVPQILEALCIAADKGLRLPLVYNSGGYDAAAALKLLDGVVDIYMPDTKFWDKARSRAYLQAPDYPDVCRAALAEMNRQVGDLVIGPGGLATRGLLVRHLVMPGGLAGSEEWMRFLAERISPATYVNVMGQYRPCGRAGRFPELLGHPSAADMAAARAAAAELGLRLDDRKGDALRLLRRMWGE